MENTNNAVTYATFILQIRPYQGISTSKDYYNTSKQTLGLLIPINSVSYRFYILKPKSTTLYPSIVAYNKFTLTGNSITPTLSSLYTHKIAAFVLHPI